MIISKRELTCLVDNMHEFFKKFDQASRCIQIPLPEPKVEIGSTKSKTIFLLITLTMSLNIQIDIFVYHSYLETTILAYFPSKSLNYTAITLFLQRLSTLTNLAGTKRHFNLLAEAIINVRNVSLFASSTKFI